MSILRLFARLEELGINLELLEGQLKINAPRGTLTPDLIDQLRTNKPEIIDFLQTHAQREETYTPIDCVEKKQYYPLSSAQKRLYILQEMDPGSTAYNMPAARELQGVLDRKKLAVVFHQLISRHESLRTALRMVQEEPVQVICATVDFDLEYHDLCTDTEVLKSAKPNDKQITAYPSESVTHTLMRFIRPFDLSKPPLLRLGLIKLPLSTTISHNQIRQSQDTVASRDEREHRYILMADMHHSISDGTSLEIFIKEFMNLYANSELPLLSHQYKDYTQWQQSRAQQAEMNLQKQYWLKEFHGEIPVLNLPTDFPRPAIQGFAGAALDFQVDRKSANALKQLASTAGTTLYMVLLAVYSIFLAKLGGQEDIIVGTPVAGRRHAQLGSIIGMFVNTLALRISLPGEKTCRQFLEDVKNHSLTAFSHQDYPYEELVEAAAVDRNAGRNPLFDTLFTLQNLDIPELEMPGLKILPCWFEHRTTKFDLSLNGFEKNGNLRFSFEYSTHLFKKVTIQRFSGFFQQVISAFITDNNATLAHIEITPEQEKNRILLEFNNTATPYPQHKTIHELFAAQAEKSPDVIALTGLGYHVPQHTGHIARPTGSQALNPRFFSPPAKETNMHLTYNELNVSSNHLACRLLDEGVKPNAIVGIMVERCIEMITGILGVLKTNGIYLPLDPEYPEERLDYMLTDCNAQVLVTAGMAGKEVDKLKNLELKKNLNVIYINSNYASHFPSSHQLNFLSSPFPNPAYIMYTSGTTGKAKGVLVTHKNVVRLVVNTNFIQLTDNTRILLTGAPVFDATTFEIWGALLHSGQLTLVSNDTILDAGLLNDSLTKFRINTLWLSSPLFNQLMLQNSHIFTTLKFLLVGGDVLSPRNINKVRNANNELQVINGYGPTENTTFSTTYSINTDFSGDIPVGKPINNSTAYILDRYGFLLPVGLSGELAVGGDGLAQGYLNCPELTADKFCFPGGTLFIKTAPPGPPGKNFLFMVPGKIHVLRLYMTGDLCRWLTDGNIQFMGRKDDQVKIRGFRVELGEIENSLMKHPDVKSTIVTAYTDMMGDKYICAYVLKPYHDECNDVTKEKLKEYLGELLPGYMIPSYFIFLEKIPLNPNGKVNRKALPSPSVSLSSITQTSQTFTPPRNDIEKKLALIWADILARDDAHASQLLPTIGIDDNFFDLGGHSLKAALLTAKIQKLMDVKIPLAEIFVNPTINKLARFIQTATKESYSPINPTEKKEFYPLSSSQNRFYILQEITPESIAYNMTSVYLLEGNANKNKFEESLKLLINRHETLRTSFLSLHHQPVQRIHEKIEFKIDYYDNSHHDTKTQSNTKDLIMKKSLVSILDFIHPFDLSQPPLLRLGLIKLEEEKHILMFDMHHIISDGTSISIFLREFMTLYANGWLSALRLQYKDFAQWQHDQLKSGQLKKYETYWLNQFPGELPVLNMPTDFPRPTIQSFEGDKFSFQLDKSLTSALHHLIKHTGTTLYMTLLAALNILLARYTGQEDIVIGLTIAGRPHPDLQKIIGLLIETLVQRNYPIGNLTFLEFLEIVKQDTLKVYENQSYPFRELIRKLGAENEISRNPVFDAMLIVQNFESTEFELEGLKFSPYLPAQAHVHQTSKVDFTIEAVEMTEEIHCTLEYCTRLYKRETMDRFTLHFINIIKEIVKNPHLKLSLIQMITEEEKQQILKHFNDTTREFTYTQPVHQRFEHQAKQNPLHIAVIEETGKHTPSSFPRSITYSQLNKKSDQLAYFLKKKGLVPDTIAAIIIEPSLEMIIGLWGILKAGGAYLPIEPDYPPERIHYILKESKVKFLVKKSNIFSDFLFGDSIEAIHLDDDSVYSLEPGGQGVCQSGEFSNLSLEPLSVSGTSLAYVIYTSGTSGRPKGVLVEHRNLAVYIDAFAREFGLCPGDTVIQLVSFAFDAFVEEFYPILLTGGKLAIPGRLTSRDIPALCDFIEKQRVTVITCSPLLLNELDKYSNRLSSVRLLISGGDRLKGEHIKHLVETTRVYNTYGPTESTVCATYYRCPAGSGNSANIPIGKPIVNYRVTIQDRYNNLLPIGVIGEISIEGQGVARGYLNRPELTNKKFIKRGTAIKITPITRTRKPHAAEKPANQKLLQGVQGDSFHEKSPPGRRRQKERSLYRTGDIGRWLRDGNIQFIGRIDSQVKIRGYRIELGEIESCLIKLDGIEEAVVIEQERKSGERYLAAYVVSPGMIDAAELKSWLSNQLPDYMVPAAIIKLGELPRTQSGKIDRKRLPSQEDRSGSIQAGLVPGNRREKQMAAIWREVLEINQVGVEDNFFDLGGTSLDIMKLNTRIKEEFNKQIPVVSLFKYTTIRSMVHLLFGGEEVNKTGLREDIQADNEILAAIGRAHHKLKMRSQAGTRELEEELAVAGKNITAHRTGLEIAVIGMAGMFPGAGDLREFWENLKNGVEGICFFSNEELSADGVEMDILENANYIKARGIVVESEYFDAAFFGYTPLEARVMDPQMRLFLQNACHALEDAGYDPFSYSQRIGLYAGASSNYYWEGLSIFSNISQGISGFMVAQLVDKDFMCTHISYKLNLKGPSYAVQTACSTSLTAIHLAVRGLLQGECEMMLAGGVYMAFPQKRGYIYQEGMIFSPDGHNRTFDTEAKGSIFGDGVGVVLLKELDQALADGDHIYAVIKGTAVNNDGARKVGYTAPSVQGQVEVIRAAQLMAEIEPETITYIEAHGTATPLGDTVEMEALNLAFNTDKKGYCAIGTVKSNLGHLNSAAGVVGFIKTALALKHRLLPPSLHFTAPNAQIDFANSPFYVNTGLKEWKNNGYPRRAGVSSFGIGGTNAHVILEEAPEPGKQDKDSRQYRLLLLSARTPTALEKQTGNLIHYLKNNPGINLADMAYTLQQGRRHFPYRRMLVSSNLEMDADKLALYMKRVPTVFVREANRPIVFMFCGQGSQYVNMGIDLYRNEPVFREEMDRCFEILKPLMDVDIREIIYPGIGDGVGRIEEKSSASTGSPGSVGTDIHQTEITQPVIFAFEYALAMLLIRWGIKPWAMSGYSFGEYIAACIAGVFSLEDALRLVIFRGRLTQQTPPGAMTSVPLPEKELAPLLNKDLSLAIVNGPTCIVSGPREAVAAFETEMKNKRKLCVPLNMSQAIHSSLMTPIRSELQEKIREFHLNEPTIPLISNVTAQWLTGEQAVSPIYWGDHLCSTVRFSDGLKELIKQDNAIFIEIGAGRILGMMVRIHPDKKPGHIVLNTVKHQQEKVTDDYFLLDKLGHLWLQGQRIDWTAYYGNEKRYRVPLPGYPFEGSRYGLDPNIVNLKAFPMGSNEQNPSLTRTAPGPFENPEQADETYAPPRNEWEQAIAQMWQEHMGVEKIGIHDDFFYLNGNSLIATQLMARIMQEYRVEVPVHRFYENPTIAHLAALINELTGKK